MLRSDVKEEGKAKIAQLVREFRSFAASQDESEANEERVKIGFIAPLLEALRWNMRTDEVLPEQRTLGGEADFGLCAYGATPQVYVECKAFRESLDGHRIERGRKVTYPEKAIQYAWSMKADWAILTNFKKLRLYYSRVRKPSEGLVFEISFEEFSSRFDEIWLVSKDSITSGAIETYQRRATRNYVDEEFLRDLIECRQLLLDNIREKNSGLTPDDLNESAQRILDRMIFVRSCEDRNIIPAEMLWKHYMHWQEVAIDKTVRTFMMDLKNMFRDIDRVYNGKLFEPHVCEDLEISNAVLGEILERLYGDDDRAGYRFDAIPVNVLGQAYELYIGSVIKEKTGAVRSLEIVEDYKKRQQHGIYYTPTFVTHFIVRRTLDKILEGAGSGDDVTRLKLVDQAAGSGSFLIEAFDRLRDAYLTYKREYEENAKQAPLELRLVQPEWTNPENTILQNNIFGVDLDAQAVEITTLNLELKAVRTKGRIPYLGDHIKQGNSILGHTADELLEMFTEEELREFLGKDWRTAWGYKHPFKYHESFREIMSNGGFDIVVGNPPYNNMRDPELRVERAYCEKFHEDVFRGNSDILFYFIEGGLSILKIGGFLGLIVARYFLQSEQADRLRKHILEYSKIQYIVDTRNVQVFGKVNVLTCIVILEKDASPAETKSKHKIKVVNVKNTFKGTLEQLFERIDQHVEEEQMSDDWIEVFEVEQGKLDDTPWTLEPRTADALLEKIRTDTWSLDDIADVGVGFLTGMNDAVPDERILELASEKLATSPKALKIIGTKVCPKGDESRSIDIKDLEVPRKTGVFILPGSEAERLGLEKKLLVPFVMPHEVERYAFNCRGNVLIKTDRHTDIDRYPKIKAHLVRFKQQLEQRFRMPECKWYGISILQNRELFETAKTKIMFPAYATSNRFALDQGNNYYCINTGNIIVSKNDSSVDIRYILAVLNSRLMEFYHKRVTKLKREGYYEYFVEQVRKLPIKKIDIGQEEQRAIHDTLVDLVSKLVDAKERFQLLERTFDQCTALYPSNEKRSRLKSYYEYAGVKQTVLGEFNRNRGTIFALGVSKQQKEVRICIDYLPEGSSHEGRINGAPALNLEFEDERLRDFVYFSLRKSISETSKQRRRLGKGNVLKVLQEQIEIPSFVANQQENIKIVHIIVNQFRTRTKGLLGEHDSIEQLEEEICSLDDSVETEIHKLYGITKDEADIIQAGLI